MFIAITGNPNVGFKEEDIEGDFDPKKYDEAMKVPSRFVLKSDLIDSEILFCLIQNLSNSLSTLNSIYS